MPVTWLQFELGGIDTPTERWMHTILGYLRDHKGWGYSEDELRSALSCLRKSDEKDDAFSQALDILDHLGGVEMAHVRGNDYFRYLDDVPELEPIVWPPILS
jgi:hypothetical protein